MTRRRHLLACLLLGCHGSGDAATSGSGGAEAGSGSGGGAGAGATEPGQGPDDPQGSAVAPGIELPRGLAHDRAISEVYLDPRASAALSLDTGGGVRLWPTLPSTTEDLAALAPIRVPLREPVSLSLARVGERAFVIAAIDTIQAGQVLGVEIDESGVARFRERFVIPPDEPLLELHAFDGGERVLALGVDHRLRLFDGNGKQLAELAQYGLAPWQLRIAGPPEAPQLAMILVGPTRIQRLSIAGDRIAPVGEPHPFVLDRGPNHNDLALLPSGKVAAVLRRPKAKGTQWSLELHELESGEVRVMWGEAESKVRPRLYVVDDQRALLEDGSGAGYWLDLSGGVTMPAPFELPKELETLPPESRVTPRRVELPESTIDSRRQTAVVAGLRAVPQDKRLLLDPLDADHHHRLGHDSLDPSAFALDVDASALALALPGGGLIVESLADGREHVVVGCSTDPLQGLAFADPDHLVLVEGERVKICAWRTGQTVSEVEIAKHDTAVVRVAKPGSGTIGLMVEDWGDEAEQYIRTVSQVGFTDNRLGAVEPVAEAEVAAAWPELDANPKLLALDASGRRYTLAKVDTREFDITTATGEQRRVKFAESIVNVERLTPSPTGAHVAIVHEPASEYDYDDYSGYGIDSYYDGPDTLSVWSMEGETPKQLWSIPAPTWIDLAWSGDGSKLVLERPTGVAVLTPEGEIVTELVRRPLSVERRADAPEPTAPKPEQP